MCSAGDGVGDRLFAFVLCPPAMAQAAPEFCTDVPGFDRAEFHKEFNAEVLAFFRTYLGGVATVTIPESPPAR